MVCGAQPQEPDGRGSGVPELVEGQRPGGGDLLAVPGDLQGLPPLGEADAGLQDMSGLIPGTLIIHLRKLEEVGYLSSKTKNGTAPKTTAILTSHDRAALAACTRAARPARRPVNGAG